MIKSGKMQVLGGSGTMAILNVSIDDRLRDELFRLLPPDGGVRW